VSDPSQAELEAVAHLRSPRAIRERCEAIYERGFEGALGHFAVHPERLAEVASRVAEVTKRRYPTLDIPFHGRMGHFDAGGVQRSDWVRRQLAPLGPEARARAELDLIMTSVLLDAGAGPDWSFHEGSTGRQLGRSEGLAVASLHMFLDGSFSAHPSSQPMRADAEALEALPADALARGFQVDEANPLVGLEGRAGLMHELGRAVRARPDLFGKDSPRPGGLFDALRERAEAGRIPAPEILGLVLEGLQPIWPSRIPLGGVNLGDVWRHPAAGGSGPSAGLVPFHKLSQWLVYSMVESLEAGGLEVTDPDALTGLAEYRNGGLFLDGGVLEPRYPAVTEQAHRPDEEVIVEWRALTIALLDRTAERVREELGQTTESMPLARVLEGGTWAAGREIARERRAGGEPPIRVISDGTVF
jgi:hypothetical protein